jgi:hypothetical protein
MFDFPSTPSVGAVYTNGGVSYAWDGQAWNGGPVDPSNFLTSKLAQLAARNNILYNGDFSFSQKAGFAVNSVSGTYTGDGWLHGLQPGGFGSSKIVGRSVALASPLRRGRYCIQFNCLTAKATLAATDFIALSHPIEGNDIAPLSWGLATGVPAILRFGFKGPAGTYGVSLTDDGPSNYWNASFTITAGQANQDTIQVFTIPPPPATGSWVAGAAKAATLRIGLGAGSTYSGVVSNPAGAWMGTANIVSPTGGFNFLSSTANIVEIFDVKLVGDYDNLGLVDPGMCATDYATEFQRCQRYYQRDINITFTSYCIAGGGIGENISLATPMRAAPNPILRTAGTLLNCSAPTIAGVSGTNIWCSATVTALGNGTVANYIYDFDAQL